MALAFVVYGAVGHTDAGLPISKAKLVSGTRMSDSIEPLRERLADFSGP